MDFLCVCIAAFMQVTGYSVFIKQSEDECSEAPPLGSFLFLFATMCFLWDINIYPCRFRHMGKAWLRLFELAACIFLAEVATLVIWCGVERIIYRLTERLIKALVWENCDLVNFNYWMHGLTSTIVGGIPLCFMIGATQCRFGFPWKQLFRMLGNIWRMDSCARRRTLRACQLAMFPPQRQCDTDEEEEEEESDCD